MSTQAIRLNGNYWRLQNLYASAGSLEELERRAKNLKLSIRKANGGLMSAPEIREVFLKYFDRIYPKDAKQSFKEDLVFSNETRVLCDSLDSCISQ